MRCFTRYLAYSAASFLLITSIAGFAIRVPGPAAAWLSDNGASQPGRPQPNGHKPSHQHKPVRGRGCEPVHVFGPKHGFRPLRATNAQLLAHGFPPRPPKSREHALRMWRRVIGRANKLDRPQPVCGTSGRSTVHSGNWAGRVVPKSYYGNASITAAQSEWVQPAVPGDPNYINYNDAPTVSIWAGVGVIDLMQAGVDSISTVRPRYRFWTEDYPRNMVWEGPAIRAGQIAFVYVRNVGRHRAFYFLENVTTGTYSAFINPLPYVGTRAANFVLERPNGRYLPSFKGLNVWNNYFWQNSATMQLTSVGNRWVMTSNCRSGGVVLAQPSDVSGGQFRLRWSHSRPFANYC